MLFYYIDTIEQVVAADDFPWTVNEYGARTKYAESYEQVQSRYFKKLSDVSNDIIGGGKEDAKHYYMDIKIVDSDGNIHDKYKLGKRQEVEPRPEPNEEG